MSYNETVFKILHIKGKYNTAGDILFRCALQHLIDVGARHLTPETIAKTSQEIIMRHNKAAKEGKHLFMTSDFEIAIVACAAELAQIDITDLLIYVQREMYYDAGDGKPSYQRLANLVQKLGDHIIDNNYTDDAINFLRGCDLTDDELIDFFGFSEGELLGGNSDDSEC